MLIVVRGKKPKIVVIGLASCPRCTCIVALVAPALSPALHWHLHFCCAGAVAFVAPALFAQLQWHLQHILVRGVAVVLIIVLCWRAWNCPCRTWCCHCCMCCPLAGAGMATALPFWIACWLRQCQTLRHHVHCSGICPFAVIAVCGIDAVSGAVLVPAFASPDALAAMLAPLSGYVAVPLYTTLMLL